MALGNLDQTPCRKAHKNWASDKKERVKERNCIRCGGIRGFVYRPGDVKRESSNAYTEKVCHV